jgi:deoxyribodipyrimidine photo-lyase
MTIFWFRRDLRLFDNVGLYNALTVSNNVMPLFIFDEDILKKLEKPYDARIQFIYNQLGKLKLQLNELGTDLKVKVGKPFEIIKEFAETGIIRRVIANDDYEPYAIMRDSEIRDFLKSKNIEFRLFKDHVIFHRNDILKEDGKPYTVYTPYSKKWKQTLNPECINEYKTESLFANFQKMQPEKLPERELLGFKSQIIDFPKAELNNQKIENYHMSRDYPAIDGTTKISMHLRFGTISIRETVKKAILLNDKWLNELIWREFYQMILFHFPHSATESFKQKYRNIEWVWNEKFFESWCEGKTGFPIVDAGIRELISTGFMHNRVRMITAGFLTKLMFIDWRLGESFFAKHLLDYDCASNVGGWQWSAGTGCDASPYFRIFNPISQAEKYDSNFEYIRKWIPGFTSIDSYIKPVIDYKAARTASIAKFRSALG